MVSSMLLCRLAQYFFGLVFLASSSFAFSSAQFTYNVIQEGIEVTGCVDECLSDLIIPAEIDGHAVKRIDSFSFWGIGLKSLTIPESVTSIGDHAFGANDLINVTIPPNITTIEEHTFVHNQLQNVIIPEGVRVIGNGAFGSNQ